MIHCQNHKCAVRFSCFRYMAYMQDCRPKFANFVTVGEGYGCNSHVEIKPRAKLDPTRIRQREIYGSG